MRTLKVTLSMGVTLGIMVLIFCFSAQSGGESGSLSDSIARMLASTFVGGFETMPIEQQAQIVAQMSWPIRKTAHASEYASLAISLVITCWQLYAWRCDKESGPCRRLDDAWRLWGVAAFVIAVLYACSDEIHQLFIDGRAGQVADVLVDASGAAIGCLLMCW
ncbi:MAG TPA: VanZ family protein [Coriobacteriaceae bacterium]|nr:VanZ family protein [Coriobacteriaceae bacterium]